MSRHFVVKITEVSGDFQEIWSECSFVKQMKIQQAYSICNLFNGHNKKGFHKILKSHDGECTHESFKGNFPSKETLLLQST